MRALLKRGYGSQGAEGRQVRAGVARAADAGAVRRAAQGGNRAAVHGRVRLQQGVRRLSLRGVLGGAVQRATRSSSRERAGRASPSRRSRRPWSCVPTTACSCAARRSSAAPAAATSGTSSTTARGRRASATASTRPRCRSRPQSSLPPAMIMQDQSRRLSEPLRWGRREKTVVAVLLGCVVLALVGLGAYALTSGGRARKDCIEVTFASHPRRRDRPCLRCGRPQGMRDAGRVPARGHGTARVLSPRRLPVRLTAAPPLFSAPIGVLALAAPARSGPSRQMSKRAAQVLARMALPASRACRISYRDCYR